MQQFEKGTCDVEHATWKVGKGSNFCYTKMYGVTIHLDESGGGGHTGSTVACRVLMLKVDHGDADEDKCEGAAIEARAAKHIRCFVEKTRSIMPDDSHSCVQST